MSAITNESADAPALVPDVDTGFTLAALNESAWVRVGNVSVYLRQTRERVIVETYRFSEEASSSIGEIQHLYEDAALERDAYDALALSLMRSALGESGLEGVDLFPSDPRGANCGGAYAQRLAPYPSVELAIDPEEGYRWRLSTNTDCDTIDIVYLGHALVPSVVPAVMDRLVNVFGDSAKRAIP